MQCCEDWWASLDEHMKQWVHYYFYDIHERLPLPRKDIQEMHDFRFEVEIPKRKEGKTMRFPTELAAKAREVEPNFPMGLVDCEAWLKDHATCEGCQHYDKCQYFGLGVLVAIGRTEEILTEMKVGIGQKEGR